MDFASKEFLKLYSILFENKNSDTKQNILENENSFEAYCYARDVIEGRWPEAEDFIKKDTYYAFRYARDVIQGRWPEAEEFIKKSPESACLYAENVIKGRWPEAEEYIKGDSQYAYYYARDLIKGRWTEAEESIKKYPLFALRYAAHIIKGRWPEAEQFIKKNSHYWDYYLDLICQECKGEGVIDLGIGGAEDQCELCNGTGFYNSDKKLDWH